MCVCFVCKDFRKQVNYEVDQRFHVSKKGLEQGGSSCCEARGHPGGSGLLIGISDRHLMPTPCQSEELKCLFGILAANPGCGRGIGSECPWFPG